MNITCALSDTQIEKLYANVYGTMNNSLSSKASSLTSKLEDVSTKLQTARFVDLEAAQFLYEEAEDLRSQQREDFILENKGKSVTVKPFDPIVYMQDLFNKIAKKTDADNASKFLQHVPSLIIHVAIKKKFENLNISLDKLNELSKKFRNDETGLIEVLNEFNPVQDPKLKKAIVKRNQTTSFGTTLTDSTTEETTDEARLKPFSVFSATYQEFSSLSPELKTFITKEVADESKKRTYTVLNSIKDQLADNASILTGLEYEGTKLALKAVKLIDIDRSQRDAYTIALIGRSAGMMKEGTAKSTVTQADQLVALIVSDKEGNELYFDNDGKLTTKENGKLVYQLMRDVKVKNGKYEVSNIYSIGSQIMSPEVIAKKEGIPIDVAEKIQQQEFEEVYKFRNSILTGSPQVITLTGISPGVSENIDEKKISWNVLYSTLPVNDDVFQTIEVVSLETATSTAGNATIRINDQTFKIDRPSMTEKLAQKIAAVITNPNISDKDKFEYTSQFLNNNVAETAKRHNITYDPVAKIFSFDYNDQTYNQKILNKEKISKDKHITSELIKVASQEKLQEYRTKIEDVLLHGMTAPIKEETIYYPTKIIINKDKIDSKLYRDYDLTTNDFVDGPVDYIEFLKDLNPKIQLNPQTDPSFFNAYMSFRLPDAFMNNLKKAEETIKNDKKKNRQNLNFLEKKNLVAESLKNGNKITGTIRQNEGGYTSHTFTSSNGSEIVFYNRAKNLTAEDYSKKATLKLEEDFTDENGIVWPDPVGVYIEDKFIGYVKVSAFNKAERDAIKKANTKINKEVVTEIEDNKNLNPDNVSQPSDKTTDDIIDDIVGFLDRNAALKNKVTPEQIDAANAWVKESPLFSDKNGPTVQHVANIVNSNVYAQFVVAGKNLSDIKVLVNAATGGNMVDVYHESWHTFSQLYLTPKQKIKLYKEVRNSKPEYKYLSFLQLEEVIAEDFRTYALKEKTSKDMPVRNSIFRSILNFIKKLLNLTTNKDILFEKLYFAGKNPKLLKNYTPLVDNVMFDILNRGVEQVSNKQDDCLNRQDGNTFSNSMDSLLSEFIDDAFARAKQVRAAQVPSQLETKSGTIQILLNPVLKEKAYAAIKNKLEDKLKYWKNELGPINVNPFNELTTVNLLEKNAIAVIEGEDGIKKYVFLNSQVDEFDNLNLSIKDGDRLKGQTYEGVDIIADYYEHKTLTNKLGEPIEILVVDKESDAEVQYDNYIVAGEKPTFKLNKKPELKILTAEEQAILNKVRILQIGLTNWGDGKSGMVKYHIENSDYDIIRQKFVEIEDLSDENNLETTSRFGGQSNIGELTLNEAASKETIYILQSLFKIDKTGNHTKDVLGFKERVEFRKILYNVFQTIGGVKDPQEQYDKLKAAIKTFPEFEQLVDFKVPNPALANTIYENRINSAFFRDFGRKTLYKYYQDTIMQDGVIEVIASSVNTPNIIKRYIDNFKSDLNNPFIMKGSDNVANLKLSEVVSEFKAKNKDVFDESRSIEFANAIGLYIDNIDIIKDILTTSSTNVEYYGLGYIYIVIKQVAEKENNPNNSTATNEFIKNFKEDPIGTLMKKTPAGIIGTKEISEKTQIERIVKLQMTYGSDAYSLSVPNAEGKNVNPFINDHTMSMMTYALNKANMINDLWREGSDLDYMSYLNPTINSFTNRLQILKNLYDSSGKKRTNKELEIFISSGTQPIDEDGIGLEGTNTTSQDIYGKNLQEINGLLKGGVIEFMRTGAKSQSFGARVTGGIINGVTGSINKDAKLWVDIDKFAVPGEAEAYAFKVHMLQYLAGEVDRIHKFNSDVDKYKMYVGYNRVVGKTKEGKDIYAGQKFTAFEAILTEGTKNEILDKVTPGNDLIAYLKTDKVLSDKIYDELKNYFDNQTELNNDFLQETKYLSPDLISNLDIFNLPLEEAERVLVKAYTYNAWIHNFETATLFWGDTVQYADLHKRNTGATSVGEGFRVDKAMQNFFSSEKYKASTYAASLGGEFTNFNYDGTYNTAIVQDIERTSVYLESHIIPIIKKDYTERFSKVSREVLLRNMSESDLEDLIKQYGKDFTLAQLRKTMVDNRVAIETKPYIDMEESDGQGYITFDAYRALKIAEKNWSDDQEALFKKIVSKVNIPLAEIIEVFPVYKLQNYGHLANTELPVMAMHKFSLMPLIPSMIKPGSDWDSLHKQMMKKNIQYMTFSTGSKVGSVRSQVNAEGNSVADQIYDEGSDSRVIKSDIKFTQNKIYLEYLKNVTTMASEFKGKTISASQARGINIDGLFNNGEIINPDNKPAYDKYVFDVANTRDILELELLEEIGYEKVSNGDGTYSYKGNLTKFLSVVQKELVRKDLPDHLIKFIGVTNDNKLKYDLSFHPNASEIESLIVSMVEKRLVKQKVNGEGLIQVSSAMTNGIWDSKITATQQKEIEKFRGTNNLPFYYPGEDGSTVAMKVAIAMQGDFKNLLNLKYKGEVIGDIDTLNIAIKDEEWLSARNNENRKAITFTGVRIPIDAIAQTDFMEVYHFLDPTAGPIIIMPAEMVAKSGGDFDGDKMTNAFPNLNKEGYLITSKKTNAQINEEASLLRNQGEARKALALIKEQKKALENNLIASTKGLLSLPDNYVNLVRPNSVYILKELATTLEPSVSDIKGVKSSTSVFESGFNLLKHYVNLGSRAALGPIAVVNKLHPILSSIAAKLPTKYNLAEFDSKLKKWVETDVIHDVRMFLPHNVMTVNGVDHISVSGKYTVDGMNTVSVLFSQNMNGFLDAEKDAWVAFIQGSPEITPLLSHLFEAGVPVEYAIYFVSNPLVREYAKQQRLISGSFADYTGHGVEEDFLTKYQASVNTVNSIIPALVENAIRTVSDKIDVQTKIFIKGVKKPLIEDYSLTKEELMSKINEGTINTIDIVKITPAGAPDKFIYTKPDITNKKYYASVTAAVAKPNVLDESGSFDFDQMKKLVVENNEDTLDISIAMFLHFIELEKQVKGLQALKKLMNPDTTTVKTIQELINRNSQIIELEDQSKLDKVSAYNAMNKSVLAPFFDTQIIIDLVTPLFPLRNHKEISNFITNILITRSGDIAGSFGTSRESAAKFITTFKNSISSYIYQNNVADIKRPDGTQISFNSMVGDGPNSFNTLLFKVLKDHPLLKDNYSILNQIIPVLTENKKTKVKQKSVTLADRKEVKGQLAEVYYQNLKELGNPNVRKVENDEENTYISLLFQALPQVSMYLNGQGYSPFGFSNALPYDQYMLTMQKASTDFINNELNTNTLTFILDRLLLNKSMFKSYKVTEVVEKTPTNINLEDVEGNIIQTRTFGTKKSIVPSKFGKKNLFTVEPQEGVTDNKAKAKASIATQYIGFGEGIVGRDGKRSTTQLYREQAGQYANTGAYSSADVIFVSIPGLRGDAAIVKREQDKTIKEAIIAIEAGATILTDNKEYTDKSTYNTGEQRLYKNMEAKGYTYSEITVEGQTLGTWSKPVAGSNINVVSEAYGVVTLETNPSDSKSKEFVKLIQPQIEKQAYQENVTGNKMFMYGLRWTRKGKAIAPLNNKSFANKGLPITDAKATDGYVYDTVDQNGNSLAPVSDLQPIIDEIQNTLGIDMSDYDAVIGNIYLPGERIQTHRDTTESLSARNYPVVVYTIGAGNAINIYEDLTNPGKSTFGSGKDKKTSIPTKNGTIYTFGMDGKGRFELGHDTPYAIEKDDILDRINMPDGTVIKDYTITLTFRRAADLTPGMPTTPAKITTGQPTQPSTSVKPNVILPIGTSGSGKSTFIKSLPQENLVIISPDDMRVEFTGDINNKSKDKEIYTEAAKRAIQAVKNGKQVVFDTTNLTKDKRVPFIEAITKAIPTANIQYKLMELNPELAKQRIKAQIAKGENRANVSDENIDRQAGTYKQMLEDIKSEGITNYDTQPSTSVNEFDIADNLTPIEQNFADGQGGRQMQDKFKGKSTMDLIISGDRTRTTRAKTDIQRMAKDYNLSKISDLVGKVIRMTDKTGKQVYTRITKVAPFTQEYQDATWQKEGWVKSVTDKNVGDYPYAIEFEVVNKPTIQPVGQDKDPGTGSLKIESFTSERLINDEDLSKFKAYLEKTNGQLPKEFFTSNSRLSLFYNSATGKKEGIPQSSKWLLNTNGLYDLIDKDGGEMYLQNVDLTTGYQVKMPETTRPVNETERKEAIAFLVNGKKEWNFDSILAAQGYDYNDIIANLEQLTTQEELTKIITKILNKLC
jgi:predicted kinase